MGLLFSGSIGMCGSVNMQNRILEIERNEFAQQFCFGAII